MKRVSFYIFIGLMISLIVAIVCWHRLQNGTVTTESTNPPPSPILVNPSNSLSLGSLTSKYPTTNKGPIDPEEQAGITPNMTQAEREQKWAEWYIREAAKLVPEQKPFAFYGKVVDENTQAVAGATIHLILSTTLSNDGVMDVDRSSDDQGRFSLTDKTGSSVSVSVWKSGYYTVGSRNQSELDTTGGGSTKEHPTIFFLKKKGEGVDLITSQYGVRSSFDAKMPRDGTLVRVDLLNRRISGDGQIQLSQIKPPYASWKKATAWSFQMEIPDGGFVEQNDEFPFEAPKIGYKSKITFDFKASQPDWKTSLKKSYYIVFGNPPRFGRIDFETDIMGGGATISYVINPDGSRNLEPK